jgi:hypothetical protein
MKTRALGAAAIAAATFATLATSAHAQDAQPGGSVGGGVTTSTPPVVTSTAQLPPPPAPVATARHDDNAPDHERFVGRFAVGYFGISDLPSAAGAAAGGAAPTFKTISAPVIGVRYWLNSKIGIDGGLGLGWSTGSTDVTGTNGTTTSQDHISAFGLALHGGVPLALASGRHYTFLIVPEANIGFTSGTIKGGAGVADQDLSGFRLDLGGRVGAEIHFGFIGIPELSLQGSVGLFLHRQAFKWKQDTASASDGTTTIGTSVQSDPWALFVNNISAFYYF